MQSLTGFIYALNKSLFESQYIFLYNTHHSMLLDELPAVIYPSMSHTSFGP